MKITPENIKWFKRRDGLEFYPVAWSPLGISYHAWAMSGDVVLQVSVGLDGVYCRGHSNGKDLIPIFEPGEMIRVWNESPERAVRVDWSSCEIHEEGVFIRASNTAWLHGMKESDWKKLYG